MKKIAFEVDEEKYKKFKSKVIMNNITVKKAFADFIENY